jgi:ATP-dependent Clp protease adaptor protein ClpS
VAEPPAKREVKPAPPRVDELPKYKVLLHNDDVNSFEHVIETIVTLTPHPIAMARKLTLEAHLRGLSLLLVTHKERAELYREQFHSRSLTVSIEPEYG